MLQVFYGMMVHIYLACMLRTYRTCNSTVEFSKYEFNNKLLTNPSLDYIIFVYSLCLQNFKVIKDQ